MDVATVGKLFAACSSQRFISNCCMHRHCTAHDLASAVNMLTWHPQAATILGPADSPFDGGIFSLKLTFTDAYPSRPPRVRFCSEMWHPNVSLCVRSESLLWAWGGAAATVWAAARGCNGMLAHDWQILRAAANVRAHSWTFCTMLNIPRSHSAVPNLTLLRTQHDSRVSPPRPCRFTLTDIFAWTCCRMLGRHVTASAPYSRPSNHS
jgi:hypothetical protein